MMTAHEAGLAFVDLDTFTDEARFHAAAAVLRRDAPLHRVEHPDVHPFRIVSRHADVLDIEMHSDVFLNAPRTVMRSRIADDHRNGQGAAMRSLVHMDDPEHRWHRQLVAEWFLPKNLAKLEDRLLELAERAVDRMIELGGECDFAADISMQYPLQVILTMLGLPETDFPHMLRLTQELFGAGDPEFRRDDDPGAGQLRTVDDFAEYFKGITADRRRRPSGDLATVIANGFVDGRPLGPLEQIGHYIIVATAGHDTTSNAMSGGLSALIEHADQLERLRADPSLMPLAVDEMIRWSTPIKHFMRTAARDYELRDTTIRAGEDLLLSYWSANRDSAVFDDPFRFDVGRSPNKHLSFGFGIHFCLGAMLARMELKALFSTLLPRLEHIEVAGRPELTRSAFVSGLKRLPIRYSLR